MIGTARYISPEAAEGKPVDGRADVYSLALVLYEAVTGVVPFVKDTTMGTLAARIGQPLPHNDLLGPLDDVLARAAAPDVASRLDAAGLAARLGALASALPTPSALPLIMPRLEDSAPINGFRAPGVSELTDSGLTLALGAGYLKWQDCSLRLSQEAAAKTVRVATESTIAMLSYRPDTAEKDLTAARDRMIGKFRDDYTQLVNDVVIPGAKQKRISSVATVPAASSVSASQNHAVVLVFVDQSVIIGDDAPTNTASSVRITLDKINDRWLISQFEPV